MEREQAEAAVVLRSPLQRSSQERPLLLRLRLVESHSVSLHHFRATVADRRTGS